MATHHCYPGCGCAEFFNEVEFGILRPPPVRTYYSNQPKPVVVEHLVCPCNSVWMSILPPPPCPFHDVTYAPIPIDYQVETDSILKMLESINELDWYKALAPFKAPELMGELLKQLLWPLLGDSDE